jgi:hypothetical protein
VSEAGADPDRRSARGWKFRRVGKPSRLICATVPAPDGVNTVEVGPSMPGSDASFIYNMVRNERGLRVRLGYQEWCTNLGAGPSDQVVRTVVPYFGSTASGSKDRLWGVTQKGIYNCTNSSAGPALLQAWPNQGALAGYGTFHAFATAAGRFVILCDEVNGYWLYSEATDAWAQVTAGAGANQIQGNDLQGNPIDPTRFASVTFFKQRLWFTYRDSSQAFYLGLNAIYGAATPFEFGARFRSGGSLATLNNWSYDGGSGMETYLCGFSTSGDVVIYQGINPNDMTSFQILGDWNVGAVPTGRRFTTSFGGELLVLCSKGVIPLSHLIYGKSAFDFKQYDTFKITNFFTALFAQYRGYQGFSIHVHPSDNCVVVTVPPTPGADPMQLCMSLANGGWTFYRGVPMYSAASWEGQLYFGTGNGKVCVNVGFLDGTGINGAAGSPIQFSLLTAFTNRGNSRRKRAGQCRATFISEGAPPTWVAVARYGYDFTEAVVPQGVQGGVGVPWVPPAAPAGWDQALWDQAVWGGQFSNTQARAGLGGAGPDVAVAVAGSANAKVSLVQIEAYFDEGNTL